MNNERTDTESVVTERTNGQSDETAHPDELNARVYRILGEQFLVRPDRERVDAIGAWASEWRQNANALPSEFERALKRIEDGHRADEQKLRKAYTHLFRGVSERAPDPPYESLYVDGSFYSGTTTEIRQGYRWAGLDVDDTQGNEPPDHLGLELQFLGELVAMDEHNRSPDEPDIDDAIEWILDEHLAEWLPQFQNHIHESDPTPFYRGVVDLTVAVVKQHHSRVVSQGEDQ